VNFFDTMKLRFKFQLPQLSMGTFQQITIKPDFQCDPIFKVLLQIFPTLLLKNFNVITLLEISIEKFWKQLNKVKILATS